MCIRDSYEASKNIIDDLKFIRNGGAKAGIAINPDTDPKCLNSLFEHLDYILIMSVFAGFGGQEFIDSTINSMKYLKSSTENHDILIGVDGGVNLKTIDKVYSTGIDITIVGSGLYGAENIKDRYKRLIGNE